MLTGTVTSLRPNTLADLDRYLEWINDAEVTRYLAKPPFPVTRDQEEEWLRTTLDKTGPPEIICAIETLPESRHIGSIALHDINSIDRQAALGIMIGDKACWNRGLGTDAIRTLLRFAFDELNLHRVWLEVDADNAGGIRCYEKCGFREEGRLRDDRYRGGVYNDTLVMAVLAPEFRGLNFAAP